MVRQTLREYSSYTCMILTIATAMYAQTKDPFAKRPMLDSSQSRSSQKSPKSLRSNGDTIDDTIETIAERK